MDFLVGGSIMSKCKANAEYVRKIWVKATSVSEEME